MRTMRLLTLTFLATVTVAGSAVADEAVNVTPPLFREQARATASVRRASELTTTPHVTVAAPATRKVVADAAAVSAR
ncbi:hypothetical protein MPPM_1057 [Methylorubrum populi]|uniref:Uncharacterized protein n=1 Tax=Methylorubrum populi TaxID=223967 RepID=A0A161JLR1_9HYPH|nr:hypothetical protein [Methylorubrum populi]BAU89662.1 hypothetical protein MPPM_1057 [Methylorubrum populi]